MVPPTTRSVGLHPALQTSWRLNYQKPDF